MDIILYVLITLVVVAVIFFIAKKGGARGGKELWLTFWSGGLVGMRIDYGKAPQFLKALGRSKKHRAVVVVDMTGPILNEGYAKHRDLPWVADPPVYGLELGNLLKRLSMEEKLAAVFVRMSTPGGTVFGSQSLFEGLQACKDAGKPVYCFITLAASGGVWAMMGASRIFADPQAILGSIGVIGPSLLRFKQVTSIGGGILGTSVRAGEITSDTLYEGKGKTFGDPFAEPDAAAVKSFKQLLGDSYEAFLSHVAKGRNIPVDKLHELGAVLFGAKQALGLGLIDAVGSQEDAQLALAKELGVEWKDCRLLALSLPSKRLSLLSASLPAESTRANRSDLVRQQLHLQPVLAISPLLWGG